MFMLSFYLRGMSFIDMAYLRKADLECGIVTSAALQDGAAARNRMDKGDAGYP